MVTAKLRERNISSGIKGCFERIIKMGSAIVATTPTANAMYPMGSRHALCWP